jgi:hypothetical protein
MDETAPTEKGERLSRAPDRDEIRRAALKWCGQKGRETFMDDIRYFEAQWPYLPGLKAYVDREVAGREALRHDR